MTITKTLIALAVFTALAPTHIFAASLYGGGTAQAGAADISVGIGADVADDTATGSPSSSSAGDDATVDVGLGVGANADFSTYAETVMNADSRVASVNAGEDDSVAVEYWHDGKLFGLFPVKVKSETRAALAVNGSADVETHMPWWNFMVMGTGSAGAMVDEELSTSAMVAADLKMAENAAARARIVDAIIAAHADARMSAGENE